MYKIPKFILKDKQAFDLDGISLIGEPVAHTKNLFDDGFKLIHICDTGALKGLSTNMDVYDKLTYFVNIEVECFPKKDLLSKLVSIRSRIVVSDFSDSSLATIGSFSENKKLFIAKVSKEKSQKIDSLLPLFDEFYLDFYPDSKTLEKISSNKKRLILNHSDYKNLKNKKGIFGIILD
jgi:hypothetical protein